MVDKFGIKTFSNTNIIGQQLLVGDVLYKNVAFIGDYSSLNTFYMKSQGVIDIKGQLPQQIMNNLTGFRYLNIWTDVSRETNVLDFPVAVIRGTGGSLATTGDYLTLSAVAQVIIYHKKYSAALLNNGGAQPNHRAFMINVGGTPTPKITGGSIPSGVNTAWYQGAYPGDPIPCLDESAWIEFANGRAAQPPDLAANYAGLPEGSKMTQEEWDAF